MIENMILPCASWRVGQPLFRILSCGDAYAPRNHADVMSCSFGNTFKMAVSMGTRSLMGCPPVSSFSSNQMKMGVCLGWAPDQVDTPTRQSCRVAQVLFGSMRVL